MRFALVVILNALVLAAPLSAQISEGKEIASVSICPGVPYLEDTYYFHPTDYRYYYPDSPLSCPTYFYYNCWWQ